jgi:cell wall assembly regulator SMI1
VGKQTGLATRTLPPCGPIDVAAVWKRIEVCIDSIAPEILDELAPGATVEDIDGFEKTIAQKLPNEVRQSFLVHNGQSGDEGAIFYGLDFFSLANNLNQWSAWASFEDDPDCQEHQEDARESDSSLPEEAIQLAYTNRSWIPVVGAGKYAHYGLDLSPGPRGISGQLINFGLTEGDKVILAWSWGWFLNDLAVELERGNFRVIQMYPWSPARSLALIDPIPTNDNFSFVIKEWSQAKSGGRRPFGPLSPEDLTLARSSADVRRLAEAIAADRSFDSLPILGDALEEAGCTDAELLDHCRNPGEHGCGCWAVNNILGKE